MLPTRPALGSSSPRQRHWTHRVPQPTGPPATAEIALAGEFDVGNCASIATEVARLCRTGFRRIRIDLGSVTFVDAATLGTFVAARQDARTKHSCDVVLSNVHGTPLRLMQMVQLDAVLIERDSARG